MIRSGGGIAAVLFAWIFCLLATPCFAQAPFSGGVAGPIKVSLGAHSELRVPEGYVFLDGAKARIMLAQIGNTTNGREVGVLAPSEWTWYIVFRYEETGHVLDDEKDKLNAEYLLGRMIVATEAANAERVKLGFPPLHVERWAQEPMYNEDTHNLEWAALGRSEGQAELTANMEVRLLGRTGVTSARLVCTEDQYRILGKSFQRVLRGFDYKEGHSYLDYQSGDKLASYGLQALVLGGGAALAAEMGLFRYLGQAWKAIVAGVGIIVSAVIGLFRRRPKD